MLAGRPPFDGTDTIATLMAVAADAPVPPNKIDPALPPSVSDLILHLLAKATEDRPESAQAVARAIAAIERDLAASPPPRRRRPSVIAAAAAFTLVIMAAIVITIKTDKGTLVPTVNEPDVNVVVDGSDHLTIESPRNTIEVRLASGSHMIVASKEGFETVTRAFKIVRGGKEEVSARLEPRAPVDKGSHDVTRPALPSVVALATPTGPYDEEFPGLVPQPAVPSGTYRRQLGTRFSRAELTDFAWSPDGKQIAVCGVEQVGRVYDVNTMRPLQVWPIKRVHSLDWSGDGHWIATGGSDGLVRLWRAGDGSPDPVCDGHAGLISTTVFSPNSRWVATAGRDHTVRLWNASEGSRRLILRHPDSVLDVAWTPDGLLVAASNWYGDILVSEYVTGATRWVLHAHNAPNRGLCFIPHSQLLAAGGGEGTLRFWDMRTGTQVRMILKLGDDRAVVIAPGGDLKVSDPLAEDELVYLVQEKKGGTVKCLTPQEIRARWGKDRAASSNDSSHPDRSSGK